MGNKAWLESELGIAITSGAHLPANHIAIAVEETEAGEQRLAEIPGTRMLIFDAQTLLPAVIRLVSESDPTQTSLRLMVSNGLLSND